MRITSAEFVRSVVSPDALPKDGLPEIAFVGRSNVGKSSLLNLLMQRKLARTSATPGKTRELNFFLINRRFYFVDLPGYGYAKVQKSLQAEWKKLLEWYLEARPMLRLVLLIIDARHPQMESDKQMQEFLAFYGRRYALVRTKIDKLSKAELAAAQAASEAFFEGYEFVADVSATKKMGQHELLSKLKPYLKP
ncbi:MAG: ribosome biogenesis GTP-binding protein YihA/YsxC [Chloroherpetonaceae bacterium]|nr:ribosome biogenesis GTP-binding protein YihA/YsxC [Chloroherpetonaceae bacterium]